MGSSFGGVEIGSSHSDVLERKTGRLRQNKGQATSLPISAEGFKPGMASGSTHIARARRVYENRRDSVASGRGGRPEAMPSSCSSSAEWPLCGPPAHIPRHQGACTPKRRARNVSVQRLALRLRWPDILGDLALAWLGVLKKDGVKGFPLDSSVGFISNGEQGGILNRVTNPRDLRGLLALAAVISGAFVCLPFWIGKYVPLLDLPQHLAVTAVIHFHEDPAWHFREFFEVQWGKLTPYWFHYLALHLLAFVFPLETTSRVYLSLYAMAFPWAGIVLCTTFRRPAWLGLLATPLALNTNLYYGFLAYSTGVLLLLFAIALVERQFDPTSESRGAFLALLSMVLFFTHAQAYSFFLACALILAVTHERGAKNALRRLLPIGPSLLLFFLWLDRAFGTTRAFQESFGPIGRLGAEFTSLGGRLVAWPTAIAGAFSDGSDTALFLVWLLVLSVLLKRGFTTPVCGPLRTRFRLEALVLLACLGYVLAPTAIQGQWNISPRFAILMMLLSIPLVRTSSVGSLGLGVAVALSLVTGINAAWHHREFDNEVGQFDQAIASIPNGKRVMSLIYDNRGRVLNKWPYLHFGQYYVVRKGGVVSNGLARSAAVPIRYRSPNAFPDMDAFRPQDFSYDAFAAHYDFLLVRDAPRDFVESAGSRLDRSFESGPWAVYRPSSRGSALAGGRAPLEARASSSVTLFLPDRNE